ncbi:MAG: alkaline phosphatase [Clostridium sp.]
MISKRTLKKIISTTGIMLLGVIVLTSGISPKNVLASQNKPKNVIYLIADGMSDSVLTAARYYKDSQDNVLGNDKLAMDSIRSGFVKTNWINGPITDSAPAGTALSSGYKTNPAYIGVTPEKMPQATILEAAELKGLSTGIISTSEIMHATPAAFSSHDSARSNYNAIMKQQVYQEMEVVLGGGDKFFGPTGGGKRNDKIDLREEIKSLGYDYVTSKSEFNNSKKDKLWGMFAEYDLAYDFDKDEFRPEEPTLKEMTEKAINVLGKNDKGFFLMVEGSKIDWAAHANDPAGTIGDILAFDEAVNSALEYAKSNDNTIVVVTTDHANSGFSIGNEDTTSGYDNLTFKDSIMQMKDFKLSSQTFSTLVKDKSDIEISALITKYYGFKDITAEEIQLAKTGNVNNVLSKRAKIGYTTGGHTGGDVYLGVYAPSGVEKLRGTIDNTELPKYIDEMLTLDLDTANKKLFNDLKIVGDKTNTTYDINNSDKENPFVTFKKDKVALEAKINSNLVKIVVDGKEVKSEKLSGVTVYNGTTVYGSTDEIEAILTKAIEDNKNGTPTNPGGGNSTNPGGGSRGNTGNSGNAGNNNGTINNPGGKLPYTGGVGAASILTLAGVSITFGAKLFKNRK